MDRIGMTVRFSEPVFVEHALLTSLSRIAQREREKARSKT